MVPASEKQIAANRTRNWKHGRYAQTVTAVEGRRAKLAEKDPEFVDVFDAYAEALTTGDLSQPNAIAALSLAEAEKRRRQVSDTITEDGVTVVEELFDNAGRKIGERLRAHPLLEHERALSKDLGHTATDAQLTKKSRGEGAKDEALATMLRRDALLRGMPKDAMAPPDDTA